MFLYKIWGIIGINILYIININNKWFNKFWICFYNFNVILLKDIDYILKVIFNLSDVNIDVDNYRCFYFIRKYMYMIIFL